MKLAALWTERGIPLRDAPDRLSPPQLYVPDVPPAPAIDGELSGGWRMLADAEGWNSARRLSVKKGLDAFRKLSDSLLATGRLNHERGQYVARLVLTGKAIALGFEDGAKQPVEIPVYLFDTQRFIKWAENEISGNGHRYISVKIVKLDRAEQLPPKKSRTPNKKAPVGRPGSVELKKIIQELKDNPEFRKLLGKSKVALIEGIAKERFSRKYADGKGISRATIYRYLRSQ